MIPRISILYETCTKDVKNCDICPFQNQCERGIKEKRKYYNLKKLEENINQNIVFSKKGAGKEHAKRTFKANKERKKQSS